MYLCKLYAVKVHLDIKKMICHVCFRFVCGITDMFCINRSRIINLKSTSFLFCLKEIQIHRTTKI